MGQLLDVLDVATTFNHFNTPTNNLNDEMDEATQLPKRQMKTPLQTI